MKTLNPDTPMKNKHRSSSFLASGLAICACFTVISPSAQATEITGVTATATSSYGGVPPINLVNGSGLSGSGFSATHVEDAGSAGQWHSSGGVVDNEVLTFALNGTYDLSNIYIWQHNQPSFGRGIHQFDLLYSTDGGTTYSPASSDLNLAKSTGGPNSAQVFPLSATGVTHVKIEIDSDWNGTTNDYVGLAEVKFDGLPYVPTSPLTWKSTTNGTWDISSTTNWDAGAGAVVYTDGRNVSFDDSASITTVSNAVAVAPGSITVNNPTKDYTIGGSAITGGTGLTKSGAGKLTLTGVNTFTGLITINDGTLTIGGSGQLGGGTYASDILKTGSFVYDSSATQILSGTISGTGGMRKTGSGTLTLSGPNNNSLAGGIVVEQGTLALVSPNNDTSLVGSGTLQVNTGAMITTTGNNPLGYSSPPGLNINGGTLTAGDYFQFNSLTMTDGSMSVTTNHWINYGDVTVNASTSTGSSVSGGSFFLRFDSSGSSSGTRIFSVTRGTAAADLTISSVLANAGSGVSGINKTGAGIMVLSGSNSYTGGTTVTGGTLQCDVPDSLGSGALSISSGGAKVNLNYTGTKAVASLTLGGVAQTASGTYGSVASGATFPDDTYFAGNGTVTVVGLSGYTGWADANAPGQTPEQDHDNDGVENGIEYFMGQTGSSFTSMPGLDGTNTITWPMDPAYNGTYEVQTSPNLGTWTNVDPQPAPSGGNLSYLLPTGLGKQFVRLLVTPEP